MVRREIDIQITKSAIWSDSACVLEYISNTNKRFHIFVANSVAAIQEVSTASQWRQVDSHQNPADDASQGLSAEEMTVNSRWLRGPAFLWQPESAWPLSPFAVREVSNGDPEIKTPAEVFGQSAEIIEGSIKKIFGRFSSWYRLTKFIAWTLRFRTKLRVAAERRRSGHPVFAEKMKTDPITRDELKFVEREIVRQIQRESFEEKLAALEKAGPAVPTGGRKTKCHITKSSKMIKLNPWMLHSLLCVGGGLANGPFQPEAKHPVILPKSHHIVTLIIRHYRQVSGHSGVEHVLSLLRERFWILGARASARRCLSVCFDCKRRQARVGEQKMADLPQDRITPDKTPFTYVGVHCIGPFLIRRGGSEVRRYGVLCACLVIRAIHIEVAQSLIPIPS